MRITRDIISVAFVVPRRRAPRIDPRAWFIVAGWLLALAGVIWVTPYRPLRWPPVRTVIHLRTQDSLEVQSECNRWVMQPGIQKVQSKRQPDGTTHIVLVARK